jgi:hypothetical protein
LSAIITSRALPPRVVQILCYSIIRGVERYFTQPLCKGLLYITTTTTPS